MAYSIPTLKQLLVSQLDREAAITRKAVERFTEGHNDFKPHERSMEFGRLATLVAQMLGWIPLMVQRDNFDLDDPANESFRTHAPSTRENLLATFENGFAEARRSLDTTFDEHLLEPWTFKAGGRVAFTKPRHIAIVDSVFSHLAHHRGQLTVYLRLIESKVPALYGPSADEMF